MAILHKPTQIGRVVRNIWPTRQYYSISWQLCDSIAIIFFEWLPMISFCANVTLYGSSQCEATLEQITTVTPRFSVTSALGELDFVEAARLGFKAIVSNRPDGEQPGQLSAKQEAVLAWRAGLQFRHIPSTKHDVFTDDIVEGMADALAALEGPVLAHCASGVRSLIIWAAASARTQPVDCVIDTLSKSGHDLDFLRDDLEAQADRKRWLGTTAALDCDCDVLRLPRAEVVAA
jgi:sulfide:quinone oxidoreductase